MSNSLQETNVEEIARELKTRRDQGQRTVLFLGSRTGGLYGNEYLYETLKQFSLLNFDSLSNIDKFRECYYVLSKHFTEMERQNILVGALATLRYKEEDKLLAELIRAGFFEFIISTNIDSLLEEACSIWGTHFQTFIPSVDDITAIEQNNSRQNSIIKVYGDLESRHYLTPGESFDLWKNGLYEFFQSTLRKDVLIVGYDSVWDHAIEQIFPLTGETIWYVNETELPQRTYLDSLLKQRNSKLLLKSRGSYSSFMRALYNDLEEEIEINRNQTTTAPLPSLPQVPFKDKKKVFISYSHKDRKYLARLTTHLKGYTVDIWDDTKILPGTNWMEKIKEAVTHAEVVVLLVSANYLSSRSVKTYELPILLEAASSGNVKLLPIILDPSPSLFNDHEPLNQYQAVNSSSKPLRWMNPHEQEVIWDKLAEQVYSILQAQNKHGWSPGGS
jgi:TIR domain/SIR2-like domain